MLGVSTSRVNIIHDIFYNISQINFNTKFASDKYYNYTAINSDDFANWNNIDSLALKFSPSKDETIRSLKDL